MFLDSTAVRCLGVETKIKVLLAASSTGLTAKGSAIDKLLIVSRYVVFSNTAERMTRRTLPELTICYFALNLMYYRSCIAPLSISDYK